MDRSSQHDPSKETLNSTDVPRSDVGSGDHSSLPSQTPESTTSPQDSAIHNEGGKHRVSAMTKMLFEILQNLLADVLTMLEKVISCQYKPCFHLVLLVALSLDKVNQLSYTYLLLLKFP